jgi:hypothetical protein
LLCPTKELTHTFFHFIGTIGICPAMFCILFVRFSILLSRNVIPLFPFTDICTSNRKRPNPAANTIISAKLFFADLSAILKSHSDSIDESYIWSLYLVVVIFTSFIDIVLLSIGIIIALSPTKKIIISEMYAMNMTGLNIRVIQFFIPISFINPILLVSMILNLPKTSRKYNNRRKHDNNPQKKYSEKIYYHKEKHSNRK